MALWGTVVNALSIVAGAVVGVWFSGMPERLRQTLMHGLGLAVAVIGLKMALEMDRPLVVIASLVIGGAIGEGLRLEDRLQQAGARLEAWFGRGRGDIATAFVTAALVYCIGPMAVLGALESGLRGNHAVLYLKAALDGITAVMFSATMGIGVIFAAVAVLVYQGVIALSAHAVAAIVPDAMLQAMVGELTAVGGLLIAGIGINLLGLQRIRVGNLLPALVIAVLSVPVLPVVEAGFRVIREGLGF
ncbi:MAG: DUF554 domain-containing protein [Calditerricola sp.]|jgi:Uncharacterized membrane protein, possible Na+ channel or pump|nr:DUF554 domain-containing protein [Bacillota bacterium]MCG0313705.1 DUF554 domain-containing protein [Calditerricola sp.]